MVSKKRINWPKLCFRVIRPRIIFHERLLLLSFHSSLSFPLILYFSFFWFFLFSIFLFYFFSFLFFLHGVNSTLLELHFSLRLSTSDIWIIHYLREIFLVFALQCGGWSLVRVKKEIIRLKGRLMDNFYINEGVMKDGHFSSQT